LSLTITGEKHSRERVAGRGVDYLALLVVVVLVSWLMVPPLIEQAQRIAIQAPALIGSRMCSTSSSH
jgi:predicted PurR-regulated permease PerM